MIPTERAGKPSESSKSPIMSRGDTLSSRPTFKLTQRIPREGGRSGGGDGGGGGEGGGRAGGEYGQDGRERGNQVSQGVSSFFESGNSIRDA